MKLVIAIPCSWPSLPREFVVNLLSMTAAGEMAGLARQGITEHAIILDSSFPLDLSRNRLCRQALEMDADYLLFLDADMVYPRGFIADLLADRADVISPLYFKKAPPFAAVCAYRRNDDRQLLVPLLDYGKGVVEVDVTGCGGMLIRKEVLQKVESPWFAYDVYQPTGEMTVSEDVTFCEKAIAAGFKVCVDTRVVAGHLSTHIVGEQHWMAHRERVYEYAAVKVIDALATMGERLRRDEAQQRDNQSEDAAGEQSLRAAE